MPYKIVDIRNTFMGPHSQLCPLGSLTNSRHKYADIALYSQGFSKSYVFFNADALREALLSNPQILETKLGIKVYDLRNPQTILPKPPKADVKPEPKAIKAATAIEVL